MITRPFDTLKAVRTLEASGIESGQAEAIVTVVNREDLATKADLYRALWIQGVSIVAVIGALFSIAAPLKLL